jgi:hypothetical protein
MLSRRRACLFSVMSLAPLACNLVTGIGSLSEVPCALDCGAHEAGADVSAPEVDASAPAPESGSGDADAPCVAAPSGWAFAAFNPSERTSCPSGFGPGDSLVVDPSLGPSTCSCKCKIETLPSCLYGTVNENIGSTSACSGGDHVLSATSCTGITPGDLSAYHSMTPLPPIGGTCSPVTTAAPPDGGTLGVACALESTEGCGAGRTHASDVKPPFQLCVVHTGQVACPSDYPNAHTTGSGVTSGTCAGCACGASPTADCADASFSFFVTGDCGTLVGTMPANGECLPTAGAGAYAASSSYSAEVANAACPSPTTEATPSGSAVLENQGTVCCR